ncbi:aminopeptidase [Paenibacillus glycanilyticus]|uniref:Aminopeptidase n=1 Tax=Paenibacillus glycanilyticus TaxID=126569 RepID=A0ABQ6GGW2_9BACL|nr:aminopeptidase [Paenibacillus glycanilyticus]GLX68841.1 aminopeptidase [Paenibacillus glycanilyticus]
MLTFEQKLNNYADIIVKIGANIQQGQSVMVNATIDAPELVRLVVKKAYEAGAYQVKVFWHDDATSRIHYDLAPLESFLEEPKWSAGEKLEMAEKGAASITIGSADPDLLSGVPQEKIRNADRTARKANERYRQMSQAFKFTWSLATAPSAAWAAKVFPDLPQEEQVSKLWDTIFQMVRADQPDPIAAWEAHIKQLKSKAQYLNDKAYKYLHYVAPGTDLTLEMPKDQIWLGGSKQNEQGTWFVPNLPTEEVYSAPLRTGVNGTISSTKPLSYNGNIVDNFSFTFENGRVVDFTAEQGEEAIKGLLDTDDEAKFLGEVALVPHTSPISDSNILFYKTIFDENASCHLALGSAYSSCIKGGAGLSREALLERGLNQSMAHTDFMVGSAELNLYGITEDGTREPILLNGNWAF